MKQPTALRFLISILVTITAFTGLFAVDFTFNEFQIDDDFRYAITVKSTDIDSDGDIDILGAALNGNEIAVWLNDGNQNFVKQSIDAQIQNPGYVNFADLNDDGNMDVLAAAVGGNEIVWYENDGQEQITWTKHIIDDNFRGAICVQTADLNGDNHLDVLGAAYHGHKITIWINDGNNSFSRRDIRENYRRAYYVNTADIDSDGDLDILGAAWQDDEMTWWEKQGDNYIQHILNEDYNGAIFTAGVDLDNDNDMDIIGCAWEGDELSWWENDGDQQFTQHTISDDYSEAGSIHAVDMDGDNDLDLVSSSEGYDKISWWENDGEQNFTENIITGSYDMAFYCWVDDIDLDEDYDILCVSHSENSISWWETIPVIEEDTTEHHHTFTAGWTLMSLPLIPVDDDPQEIIGDDIDGIWAVYGFRFNEGYQIAEVMHNIPGYWLAIGHEHHDVDVRGTSNDDTVVVELDLSWNLIGNPFAGSIELRDVLFRYENTTYTQAEAVREGFIAPILYGCTPDAGYFTTHTLTAWHGYWFTTFVEGLEMLVPPPNGGNEMDGIQRDGTDGEISPEWWTLSIEAAGEDAQDQIALGANGGATDEYDPGFDFPEPPATPSDTWIRCYFRRDQWLPDLGDAFDSDIRGILNDEVAEWEFTVSTSEVFEYTLSWDEVHNIIDLRNPIPEGYQIELENLANNEVINLLEDDSYTYQPDSYNTDFRIRVTATPYSLSPQPVPTKISIGSAYPNPFNSMTRIDFSLVEQNQVRVLLYDQNGCYISTIANRVFPAEKQTISIDATGLPVGIYLVEFNAHRSNQYRKILYLK